MAKIVGINEKNLKEIELRYGKLDERYFNITLIYVENELSDSQNSITDIRSVFRDNVEFKSSATLSALQFSSAVEINVKN